MPNLGDRYKFRGEDEYFGKIKKKALRYFDMHFTPGERRQLILDVCEVAHVVGSYGELIDELQDATTRITGLKVASDKYSSRRVFNDILPEKPANNNNNNNDDDEDGPIPDVTGDAITNSIERLVGMYWIDSETKRLEKITKDSYVYKVIDGSYTDADNVLNFLMMQYELMWILVDLLAHIQREAASRALLDEEDVTNRVLEISSIPLSFAYSGLMNATIKSYLDEKGITTGDTGGKNKEDLFKTMVVWYILSLSHLKDDGGSDFAGIVEKEYKRAKELTGEFELQDNFNLFWELAYKSAEDIGSNAFYNHADGMRVTLATILGVFMAMAVNGDLLMGDQNVYSPTELYIGTSSLTTCFHMIGTSLEEETLLHKGTKEIKDYDINGEDGI